MCIEIKIAKTEQEHYDAFRFRYDVYVEEMGRPQKDANHAERVVIDHLDQDATILVAYDGPAIVGTMRQNFGTIRDGFYADFYGMPNYAPIFPNHCSVTSRLMVHPNQRGTSLAVRLCKAGYAEGLRRGMRFDFIDCNAPLLALYKRFGYRETLSAAQHPEYGAVHRLILDYEDRTYLQQVRSPFAALLPSDSKPSTTLTDMLAKSVVAA